jgi:protein-disulfide isomerase
MIKLSSRTTISAARRRIGFYAVFVACLLVAPGHAVYAATTVQDASALKPPPGVRVALVEFSDLECPACGQANPSIVAAIAKYKIPLVRHDLLIPSHNWSRIGAINARWFDMQKKGLGEEYRDAVFANQSSIYNPVMLRQFTQSFAQSHGITLPFDMDPGSKLADAVEADNQLSRRTGITVTPTIFIVTAGPNGTHYDEVIDRSALYQMLDRAIAASSPSAPAKHAKHK